MAMLYIFVDPFNSATSGVTTYTRLAQDRLRLQGFEAVTISRHASESVENFRSRVASELKVHQGKELIVEAPETLATTMHVPESIPIHIRLHGSRVFGSLLQGLPLDLVALGDEKKEISRAQTISAPSRAAVEASRSLFDYPERVMVYPNPAPNFADAGEDWDIDVLFLGRWQFLKGSFFIEPLAELLRNIRFGVAIDRHPVERFTNLIVQRAASTAEKRAVIARSRMVVVPSLFETASMVALEALAMGREVVTWSHLGIVEYAREPYLYSVAPWDLQGLANGIQRVLGTKRSGDFYSCVEAINSRFDRALSAIVNHRAIQADCTVHPIRTLDWAGIFKDVAMLKNEYSKGLIVKRKFRKLLKSPKAFFRDSRLVRAFRGPVASATADGMSQPLQPKPDQLVTTKTNQPEHAVGVLLGNIARKGSVKISDPPSKPKGWVTTFAYAPPSAPFIEQITEGLDTYKEFSPTRKASLSQILFDVDPDESVLGILNRIDVKNKERLGRIDNLILVDAPQNLATALRLCTPNIRTILVLSDCSPSYAGSVEKIIDALICPAGHELHTSAWRRKAEYSSVSQLSYEIRKLIQEVGPKRPDMLIPLIGDKYRPEMLEFDSARYQGFVRFKPLALPDASNLAEFIQRCSEHIEELLVAESVYMRYRSLCEDVESGQSPAMLIETCLMDGVLFDVA